MTLEDAKQRLEAIQFKRFRDIPEFAYTPLLNTDKGNTGKFFEAVLGVRVGRRGLDFSDGELKSTRFTREDIPKENIAVTQLRPVIDELLRGQYFENSSLYKLVQNVLIVPVYRESPSPADWMFFHPLHLCLKAPQQADIRGVLERDFYNLCERMRKLAEQGSTVSFALNGTYLQIRNKDSKPYKSIYSLEYNSVISYRDLAFWLRKDLILELKRRQGHGVRWCRAED